MLRRALLFAVLILSSIAAAPAAASVTDDVQTSWRLLDYIAVDYGGAVRGGRVISGGEYAEMREFSASVAEKVAGLPPNPRKSKLAAGIGALQQAIGGKASPEEVVRLARGLGRDLLAAYPVALGPKRVPDLARGVQLFRQNCASCHGEKGEANTLMARQLEPPPIAFTDRARASERSPFALYQVINQGLEGTAMQSFAQLPDADKWALAYHAGQLAYPVALVAAGERIWDSDPALHARIPDLDALSSLSEAQLRAQIGAGKAAAVIAYLRSHPESVSGKASTLTIARQRLSESLTAYRSGNREQAKRLALSAYLDGIEPIEPMLGARSPTLLARVEQRMGELRASIAANRPTSEVEGRVAAVKALVNEVEQALAPDQASEASTFLGAFTILLREGLEALLIVVAMLAFLRKADRPDMTRPVHYGWVGALAAGVLTWWAATRLIGLSGASRELTEGFGSILAAAVLLFVGIWMHGKAQADQWQRYIRAKLSRALSQSSAWFLFGLAFIAVYREVFETILFFTAMAVEGSVGALVGGAVVGAALLAAIAVAMLRFSQRLPIGKFFAYSSALVAVLAVVLAGKGVAALQEAGLISVLPLNDWPRISMLGLFPTMQGIAAQLATLVVLLAGFAWNRWNGRRLAAAV